ncbi:MAG: hypothetical protein QG594_1768 [Bacteroidota bacterium]|nr:hypothetical protein [Bacteroidota bacterium]
MHNKINMTEEKVTITLIKKLKKEGWKILSFDYPQSGTGKLIRPNLNEKNLGGFIPDIVSIKNGIVLFWENKDHFVYEDFIKIRKIKESDNFVEPIRNFLNNVEYTSIYFGIAIPNVNNEIIKASEYFNDIDFFVTVDQEDLHILYRSDNSIEI